jgi:hypothetical protein
MGGHFDSIVASIIVLIDHNTREPGRVTSDMLPRLDPPLLSDT